MLEMRGSGLGLTITLLVLILLIGLCSLLLVPHLLGRGLLRLARGVAHRGATGLALLRRPHLG